MTSLALVSLLTFWAGMAIALSQVPRLKVKL